MTLSLIRLHILWLYKNWALGALNIGQLKVHMLLISDDKCDFDVLMHTFDELSEHHLNLFEEEALFVLGLTESLENDFSNRSLGIR